jgi:hypothetical protein
MFFGTLAPSARIIPLDERTKKKNFFLLFSFFFFFFTFCQTAPPPDESRSAGEFWNLGILHRAFYSSEISSPLFSLLLP